MPFIWHENLNSIGMYQIDRIILTVKISNGSNGPMPRNPTFSKFSKLAGFGFGNFKINYNGQTSNFSGRFPKNLKDS